MSKLINFLVLFSVNFVYSNFTFSRIEKNYPEIVIKSLENIVNDLDSIGFYSELKLSIILLVSIVAFLNSFLIITFIFDKFNFTDLTKLLNYTLMLFFINTGVTFFVLYILRFYDFSRGTLLINIFFFPLLMSLLILFLKYFQIKLIEKKVLKIIIFILLGITSVYLLVNYSNSRNNETTVVYEQTITEEEELTLDYSEEETKDPDCFPWVGSENFNNCIFGSTSSIEIEFGEQINNLITHNKKLYVLLERGLIYKFDGLKSELFLDISSKVLTEESGEEGLFSLAFHPDENYFLVSYSNKENVLIVEKYFLIDDYVSMNNSEIIFQLPNSQCCHWGGNIIWSNFFEDFLLSVGDMEDNERAILNSEPIDTTSPRGKIILLNKEITSTPLLSDNNYYEPLNNIVAYGLRNPWKTLEYDNKLYIVDIGLRYYEELTVIDLALDANKKYKSKLLGWPIFEGPYKTIDTYTIEVQNEENAELEKFGFNGALSFISKNKHYTELFHWNNNNPESAIDFIYNESIAPQVFYDHQTDLIIRAALIGGDIITDNNSSYQGNYFFSDYLTKELFAYNHLENLVTIFPQVDNIDGFITSLVVNPFKNDSVFVSTSLGQIVEISLPNN